MKLHARDFRALAVLMLLACFCTAASASAASDVISAPAAAAYQARGVYVRQTDPNTVYVSWTPLEGADPYLVYYGIDQPNFWYDWVEAEDNFVVLKDFVPETPYRFYVFRIAGGKEMMPDDWDE